MWSLQDCLATIPPHPFYIGERDDDYDVAESLFDPDSMWFVRPQLFFHCITASHRCCGGPLQPFRRGHSARPGFLQPLRGTSAEIQQSAAVSLTRRDPAVCCWVSVSPRSSSLLLGLILTMAQHSIGMRVPGPSRSGFRQLSPSRDPNLLPPESPDGNRALGAPPRTPLHI